MNHLILVRHGRCSSQDHPLSHRIVSDIEDELTDDGRREIQLLAAHFGKQFAPALIVSSTLPRAWDSARILATSLGIDLEADERLRERALGLPLEATVQEAMYAQEKAFLAPYSGGSSGESIFDHRVRVQAWCRDWLVSRPWKGDLVVMSHGGTIEHINATLWGSHVERMRDYCVNCKTAHYHLWERWRIASGQVVWKLKGIDLAP